MHKTHTGGGNSDLAILPSSDSSENLGESTSDSSNDSSDSTQTSQNPFGAMGVYDLGRIERVISNRNVYGDAGTNATVTTITSEDIANTGAQNIGEALRFTPGVFYAPPSSGFRHEQSFYIRGNTSSDRTHSYVGVYLDGIPIDSIYQQSAFNHFNLNGISEINVSKGYVSPIYGMKSLGGAVNMVTQKPLDKVESRLKLGFVANNEVQTNAYVGSNLGAWYLSADYGYITRNSFPFSHASSSTTRELKGAWYDDHTFRAKVGFEPNQNHEYSANLTLQRGKRGGMTVAGASWPHYDNTLFYIVGRSNILDNLALHSRLFYHGYFNQLISPSWGNSVYDDFRAGGIVHLDYAITENMNLQVGLNIKDESHKRYDKSDDLTGAVAIKNLPKTMDYNELHTSIFLQYAWRFIEQLRFTISGSYDRSEMIYIKTSPNNVLQTVDKGKPLQGGTFQAILYYDINNYLTMHFNAGRKTSMPKAFSRYSSSRGSYIVANPNLQPESAVNYEIGASFDYEGTSLSGTVFFQHLNDMISDFRVASNLCETPYTSGNNGSNSYCVRQENVDEGFNYGVEFGFKQSFLSEMISFGANYTFTDSKQTMNGSSTNHGKNSRILNYPTHLVNANFIYRPLNNLDLILYATYQGKRWSYSNNTGYYTQPAVFLMDLKINYRILESLQFSIGAYNVLDKDYYDANYMIPGRRIYASIEWKY